MKLDTLARLWHMCYILDVILARNKRLGFKAPWLFVQPRRPTALSRHFHGTFTAIIRHSYVLFCVCDEFVWCSVLSVCRRKSDALHFTVTIPSNMAWFFLRDTRGLMLFRQPCASSADSLVVRTKLAKNGSLQSTSSPSYLLSELNSTFITTPGSIRRNGPSICLCWKMTNPNSSRSSEYDSQSFRWKLGPNVLSDRYPGHRCNHKETVIWPGVLIG